MALPTDSRTINDVVSATRDAMRPDLIDGLFQSNALFARLYSRGKVTIQGGEEIRVPFIYDKLPGGWYTGLGPFVTTEKQTHTVMRFDWKSLYTEITLPGIDVFKNSGAHQIFDIVAAKLTNARMTLADMLGTELYNDGTEATKLTGLRHATNTTGTYGGIARGTGAIADAVEGNVDATGGSITMPFINSLMGTASAGGAEKPDLLITTQTLWDALWTRVQPQQRYPNPSQEDIANVGFSVININGAAVTVDSHCTSGYLFGLNTKYIEFIVGEGKDFYVRGPYEMYNQDGFTAQILLYCELIVQSPRLCFQASGLTA